MNRIVDVGKGRYYLLVLIVVVGGFFIAFYWKSVGVFLLFNEKSTVNTAKPANLKTTVSGELKISGTESEKVEPVDVLIGGLLSRLKAEPGDVEGWVLLAKSYHYLQQWQAAEEAFGRAKALGYSGANPLTDSQEKRYDQTSHKLRQSDNSLLNSYIEKSVMHKKTAAVSN